MSISAASLDRASGALLGTFVGDALGMPYEGCSPDVPPRPLEMAEARLGRGTYTDDTQMMIALAESLLARGRVDEEDLARAFLALHDPRRGYGAGTTEVFRLWQAGESVATASTRLFGGRGSLGNGAAMRIAPVAVRYAANRERLVEEAVRSAMLTHSHPLAVDAALAQAAAIAGALRGDDPMAAARDAVRSDPLRDALDRAGMLRARRPSPGQVAQELGNTSAGLQSVPAAVYSASAHEGFEEAVTFAVGCGGDADTIGAMAGAIAGARFGASAIPVRWLLELEDGERGHRHVAGLAARLHRRSTPGAAKCVVGSPDPHSSLSRKEDR